MKRHYVWTMLVVAGVLFGGFAVFHQKTVAQAPAVRIAAGLLANQPDDQTTNTDLLAQLKEMKDQLQEMKDQLKNLNDQTKNLNNQFSSGSAKVTIVMNPGS
jgi:hypothetical protein